MPGSLATCSRCGAMGFRSQIQVSKFQLVGVHHSGGERGQDEQRPGVRRH